MLTSVTPHLISKYVCTVLIKKKGKVFCLFTIFKPNLLLTIYSTVLALFYFFKKKTPLLPNAVSVYIYIYIYTPLVLASPIVSYCNPLAHLYPPTPPSMIKENLAQGTARLYQHFVFLINPPPG